jgi:glycosyltransferase involved in cell wall biosynthesis
VERSRIAIVVPALNEAATIRSTVENLANYGIPIIVDDGSTDVTAKLAEIAGGRVVSHNISQGYDGAINSGFECAKSLGCEYVITFDADGQHDVMLLPVFINALIHEVDIVIGVRNKRARLAEHCFAFMTQILYGLKDPLCGIKGYKMSIYNKLGHFDSYKSIGTELSLFAIRNKFRLKQIPIKVFDRQDMPRLGHKFKANMIIFRAMLLAFLPSSKMKIT